MLYNQIIISSIKKYGVSCSIQKSPSEQINFKAIFYYAKNTFTSQNEAFLIESSNPLYATLITADINVLPLLKPCTIIKVKSDLFQILHSKKHFLSDQLCYISSTLSPI